QENLTLCQEMVEDILVEDGRVTGIRVRGDAIYRCAALILTTGTFLQAIMHTGEAKTQGGRAGEGTTGTVSDALNRLGFELARFKTGTPARLNGRTIDFNQLQRQPGDADPQPFSFMTDRIEQEQMECFLTDTNQHVHDLIRANLHRAPMYSGQINSTGPRYCPSIEDKVVRFSDKASHQIFLEPEGRRTHEIYCNGISTSLPRDVQDEMIHSIAGLEKAEIMRYGYAVEYDFAPPTQLSPTLETKKVAGLYFAGQINGTTGYEEAAGQGLIAGINAALKVDNRPEFILDRNQGYLGVLIDDLVTKGVDEPYRMFTSRAEYRLILRQDNADRRLTPLAIQLGIASAERIQRFEESVAQIERGQSYIKTTRYHGQTLEDWLRRPDYDWVKLCEMVPDVATLGLSERVIEQIEIDAMYSGYLKKQEKEIARYSKIHAVKIPSTFDYHALPQLRNEAKDKLSRIRPVTVGQAERVSGITPADLTVLLMYLDKAGKPSPESAT
ncbi:MAG TPA: tRNA uridine-5-carboxymethylaminomethyl(34) synthesis enzyme MnmG, partial [Planctomycetaceae bacterium]|nr:tRNA uridine-5-carboxymethylaminomethyl(34) synthesis enzyme MnmG [Planctomycetaceae bacterium]